MAWGNMRCKKLKEEEKRKVLGILAAPKILCFLFSHRGTHTSKQASKHGRRITWPMQILGKEGKKKPLTHSLTHSDQFPLRKERTTVSSGRNESRRQIPHENWPEKKESEKDKGRESAHISGSLPEKERKSPLTSRRRRKAAYFSCFLPGVGIPVSFS